MIISRIAPRGKRFIGWLLSVLIGFTLSGAAWAEHDDCDAGFLAFLGADAYRFSPTLGGTAGTVRLFSVLSYEQAAVEGTPGWALWRLEIRGPQDAATAGEVVASFEGSARL
ncbi:MAG TPA: hypothetical protein PK413_03510, partial [Thermoanaerobaculia bacterium]|nr:hypothetical protein [Thermoanaerobaculia bacterium]